MKLVLKERILTISMLAGAAAAVLLGSFSVFAQQCEELPHKLFRLHILANSDSDEDQQLKYDLRDYILEDMEQVFTGCTSSQDAKEAAKAALPDLTAKAQQFIYDQGCDYTVTLSVENTFFTTRSYGSFVVPAGNYDALRIVIGEGEGHNWWCVMFPPLCLGAVEEYFAPQEEELMLCRGVYNRTANGLSWSASRKVEQEPRVEVRFAVFEWLKQLTVDNCQLSTVH